MNAKVPSRVLVPALDVIDGHHALKMAYKVRGLVTTVKVGLRLYVAEGPRLVRELKDAGFEVFLDLKLHDIPTTVESAARAASELGADLLTVHASGGSEMIRAAVNGAGDSCQILAVTVLTSLDEASQMAVYGSDLTTEERVLGWSVIATDAGAKGIVCSPKEVAALSEHFAARDPKLHFVTPGIRQAASHVGDHARTATPAEAIAAGATHLVIGRPIIEADDHRAFVQSILDEIHGKEDEPEDAEEADDAEEAEDGEDAEDAENGDEAEGVEDEAEE